MKTALSGLKTVSGYGKQKKQFQLLLPEWHLGREQKRMKTAIISADDSIEIRQGRKNAEKRQINYSL